MRLHALTIDLEEWYHAELVRGKVPPARRMDQAPAAVQPILALLQAHHVRATFFIVGEVAERQPALVREIASAGHEIACHSYSHRPLWEMTAEELDRELREFRRLMEDILGEAPAIIGFRAPTFSLEARTAWALEVLAEHGYRYDSSIFPMRTPLYGVANAPLEPYRISASAVERHNANGRLVEFPLTVCQVGGRRIPVSGGTYLRLLPWPLFTWCWERAARTRPAVLYVHPWETYAGTPRVRLPAVQSAATYGNIAGALGRLGRLLERFRFAPMRAVLAQAGWLEG
jgi:polysaccharide deacetylase family protein (PEP-CTERM system associated)